MTAMTDETTEPGTEEGRQPTQAPTQMPGGAQNPDSMQTPANGQPPPLFTKRRNLVLAATAAFLTLPLSSALLPPGFGGNAWEFAEALYGLLAVCFILGQGLAGSIALFCIVMNTLRRRPYLEDYRFRVVHTGFSFALVFLVMLTLTLLKGPLPAGSDAAVFDADLWSGKKASALYDEQGITARQAMLSDLVKRVLPGRSRAEIIEILGEPDNINRFDANLIYSTGIERGASLKLDSEWLLIFIDENGIFERYSIAND